MANENNGGGTGSNLIWAITTIIVVGMLAFVFYTMVMKADLPAEKKIDVEIKTPGT